MPSTRINYHNDTRQPIETAAITTSVQQMLTSLPTTYQYQVTVRFVADAAMRQLNKKYRKQATPTDVLSFPIHRFQRGRPPRNLPPGTPLLLGDVIVNLDAAQRQAKTARHPVQREVQFLIEHGVRHLMGFHHT